MKMKSISNQCLMKLLFLGQCSLQNNIQMSACPSGQRYQEVNTTSKQPDHIKSLNNTGLWGKAAQKKAITPTEPCGTNINSDLSAVWEW